MVEALSTHLRFFVELIQLATHISLSDRGEGANILLTHGSLSPARRFASLTRFHTDSFITRPAPTIPVRSASRGHQRVPACKRDDSTCCLIVLVREAIPEPILVNWQGINFPRLPSLHSSMGSSTNSRWDFRYAVEVRTSGLLGMSYLQVLSRHGVAHVYNHWSSMPPLAEQHAKMQGCALRSSRC